jgi:ATP10 protein
MSVIKKVVIGIALVVVTYTIYAQIILKEKEITMSENVDRSKLIGTKFPTIAVKTLAKNKIELPAFTMGKPSIICIVFEQSAQGKVDTWTNPILQKYTTGQVNYYEIPMINANYKIASSFIDGGMRSGVPKELHNNVATYYGKLNTYKTDLMMYDKNSCYLFLLDSTGIIKHIDEAAATAEKIDTLFKAIKKL